ncbi:MAG TPA: amidohydrolase family protein [Terriglobales bacterium]|nr:amidohydrolase family protein [Terriglobales bacterium]HVA63556.1 amidohydrolase family protein [Terriglobales bacterium]
MSPIVFKNARIFDGDSPQLRAGDVRVADGVIEQVDANLPTAGAEVMDCGGRVLMPGLIDAHVHVYAASLNLGRLAQSPLSYLALFGAHFMRASLDRGFTTLRDAGGAEVGFATALREGLAGLAPRLFYSGRVISQTGGHGDFRPGDHALDSVPCGCAAHADTLAVIADGADAVRRAVREELRRGAHHIKIMGSGGVASPTDPLERCQYSDEEIRAAVDEAERRGAYVAAHCHPPEAVRRSVALGVRSIEHATLIDRPTADFVAERGAFVVPTMATLFALLDQGAALGLPPASCAKLQQIGDRALGGLEIMKAAGVKMVYGTDLLGKLHDRQCSEFTLRAQVLPTLDILRSACALAADLLGQSGHLGCIRPGAAADLLVVNGNPLENLSLLAQGGQHLAVIMANGQFHKRAA